MNDPHVHSIQYAVYTSATVSGGNWEASNMSYEPVCISCKQDQDVLHGN